MNKIIIQDGRASHIVVYVNWRDEEIINEAEYEAKLAEEKLCYERRVLI